MAQGSLQVDIAAQLSGRGPTQFNLAAVRSRTEELRRSIDEVITVLTVNANMLGWEDILKKFATINLQIMVLKEQIRGLLKQVVVHPKMVDEAIIAQVLPIQLASKLTPEMEAHDAELMQGVERDVGGPDVKPDTKYEIVDSQLEDFNRFICSLTATGSPLDPKGEAKQQISKSSATITSHVQAAVATAAAASKAHTSPAAGNKHKRTHSAVDRSHKLEPALLALLTGEGLRGRQPRGA